MKKYVSIFAVLLLVVMLMTSSSAKTLRRGDVNSDGSITATDARMILRAAATLTTLTDEQKLVADVDGNGKVTAKDARMVLRVSAKLDPDFEPIEIEDPTEPTTEEPTTEEPTTEKPTTEEPTTEEPTTEEPTTEEPTTDTPALDGERVEYEDFPEQIKTFASGRFGLTGYFYLDGERTPVQLCTDGKNIRATMKMSMEGMSDISIDVFMLSGKSGSDKKVYMANSKKKMYCDASDMMDVGGLDLSFTGVDMSGAYAIVSEEQEYTVYTIPASNSKVEVYMIGDEIKGLRTYDDQNNLQSRIDIDTFIPEFSDDVFSMKGYVLVGQKTLIASFIDLGGIIGGLV